MKFAEVVVRDQKLVDLLRLGKNGPERVVVKTPPSLRRLWYLTKPPRRKRLPQPPLVNDRLPFCREPIDKREDRVDPRDVLEVADNKV